LEFILYQCKINVNYALLNNRLNYQIIITTIKSSGLTRFIVLRLSAGVILITIPTLISILLIRGVIQQIITKKNYSKFKKLINRMLDDNELKENIKTFFVKNEVLLEKY